MIRDRTEELRRLHFEHAPREEPSSNGHKPVSGDTSRSDEEVIEKLRAERGGKSERLWNGDLSNYDGDHSSADDAFVHKIWSYTQDPEQVKRIHAMSGLHRPEKSGRRPDYLERSIRRAAENVTWFYEWPDGASTNIDRNGHKTSSSSSFPYKGSDSDDGFATPGSEPLRAIPFRKMGEPKEQRYIVDGLVPERYATTWHADGGSLKSILALSLGVAVSSGAEKWLGRDISTAPVLYVDFELDGDEQNRRARRIVKGVGLEEPPEDLLYLSALGHGPLDALRTAYAECERHGVKLMILDSFGPAFQGDSETAKDITGFFGSVMEPFRALGVAVLIIDHQARVQGGERYQNKSAFGSVYKTNLTRSVVQIEATERGADYVALRLRQKKHTFGAVSDPFGVEVTFGEGITFDVKVLDDADLAGEGTLNATDRVKLALKEEPAYPDELAEKTGLVPGTVKNALTKLRKAGEVETTGERKSGGAEQVTLLVTKSSSLSSSYRGNDDDDGDKPLSVAAIGEEISRTNSGPAKALATYLDKPTEERLKWLTCAVLTARGMDTGNWKRQVGAVREAATEAKNHPLDCECEECSI